MGVFDITTEAQLNPWKGTNLTDINAGFAEELNKPWTSYEEDWIAKLSENQRTVLGEQFRYNMPGGGGQNLAQRFGDVGTELLDAFKPSQEYFEGVTSGDILPNQGPDMAQVAMMADNPYMTGMIDAASRDVTRNLQENVLPGMAAYSAGTGNLGSSRRGAAEAIAERGTADRIADISSQLRGDAYRTGLNLESQRAGQNAGFRNAAAGSLANLGLAGQGMLESRDAIKRQSYADALSSQDRLQLQDQMEINAARAKHMESQTIREQQLQQQLAMALPQETAFGKMTTTTPFNEGLGALAALLGGGGGSGGGTGGFLGALREQFPWLDNVLGSINTGVAAGTNAGNVEQTPAGAAPTTTVETGSPITGDITTTGGTTDTGVSTGVNTGTGTVIQPEIGSTITGDTGGNIDLGGGDMTGAGLAPAAVATGGGGDGGLGGPAITVGGTQPAQTVDQGAPGSAGISDPLVSDANTETIEDALARGAIGQDEYDRMAGDPNFGPGFQITKPINTGEMVAGADPSMAGGVPGAAAGGESAGGAATDLGATEAAGDPSAAGGGGEVPEGEFTELWGSNYEQGSIEAEGAVFAEKYWAEGLSGDETDAVARAYSDAYKAARSGGATKDVAEQAAMLAGAETAQGIMVAKGNTLPPNLAPPSATEPQSTFGEPLPDKGPPTSPWVLSNNIDENAWLEMTPEERGMQLTDGRGWGAVVQDHISSIEGPLRNQAYEAFSQIPDPNQTFDPITGGQPINPWWQDDTMYNDRNF